MNTKLTSIAAAVLGIGAVLGSHAVSAPMGYGWQLMTPAEMAEHRAKMHTLPPIEREAYRARHHEQMKQRVQAQGLTLPDQPPFAMYGPRFGRMGYGPGYGGRRHGWRGCRW